MSICIIFTKVYTLVLFFAKFLPIYLGTYHRVFLNLFRLFRRKWQLSYHYNTGFLFRFWQMGNFKCFILILSSNLAIICPLLTIVYRKNIVKRLTLGCVFCLFSWRYNDCRPKNKMSKHSFVFVCVRVQLYIVYFP